MGEVRPGVQLCRWRVAEAQTSTEETAGISLATATRLLRDVTTGNAMIWKTLDQPAARSDCGAELYVQRVGCIH